MRLADGPRQVVAGLAAAAGFLGLFFGLGLAWWLALLGGLAVWAAGLLIVERRAPPAEVMVADGVSQAEFAEAINLLTGGAARVRRLVPRATGPDRALFSRMAELLEAIRGHHVADPGDYRITRRFLRHDLGRMIESAETYVDLAGRSSGVGEERLAGLAERIHGYVPVLEKVDQACLDNDLTALEVQVEVLSEQLARNRTV